MMPIDALSSFQGKLKHLTTANYAKLKRSIEEKGYIAPIFVWQGKILDGHQRLFVLRDMIKSGYKLEGGGVFAVEIDAANEEDAKECVLAYASRFGIVDDIGFADFAVDLNVDAVKQRISIPEIESQLFGYEPKEDSDEPHAGSSTQADVVYIIKLTYEQADGVGAQIRKLCRDNAVEIETGTNGKDKRKARRR